MKKFLLATMVGMFLAGSALANDIYVAQSAAGANTGGDCANAHAASWFNTSTNWGGSSAQIGPGTTVHLCGTFTGSAGSTMLTFQGSGSSAGRITIQFEPGAMFSAPYWSTSTGAINSNGQSYFTIDGGTNGLVKNTANGTALANQADSVGLYLLGSSNFTVQNLAIQDIYVRVANTGGGTGFDSIAINAQNGDNTLFKNLTITNVKTGVGYSFTANHSNFEVANSTFTGVEVPVIHATVTPGATFTGVLIHDNDFAGGAYLWDDPVGNSFHHEALHMWAQAANAHINGTQVYNNYIHGTWGNDQSYYNSTGGTHITTLLYFEEIAGVAQVYNNVLVLTTGGALNQTDNGYIFCKESTGQICNIYNNTFVGPGGSLGVAFETQGTTSGGHTFKNNIVYNIGYPLYLPAGNLSVTSNYNLYYGVQSFGQSFLSLAQWIATGQDANSQTASDPKLDSAFRLLTGSGAIQKGANLRGLGIVPLDSDKAGAARPTAANWDIGAYQSGATVALPNAPTITSAVVTTN